MKIIKLTFLLLFISTFYGCGQVKVEMGGLPAPNHITQAHILGLDIDLNLSYAYFYKQPEGDEFLETLEYMKKDGKVVKVRKKNLNDVRCIMSIINRKKKTYKLKMLRTTYTPAGEKIYQSIRTMYEGDLSRKTFSYMLPIDEKVVHEVGIEIYDGKGKIMYAEPIKVKYEII